MKTELWSERAAKDIRPWDFVMLPNDVGWKARMIRRVVDNETGEVLVQYRDVTHPSELASVVLPADAPLMVL